MQITADSKVKQATPPPVKTPDTMQQKVLLAVLGILAIAAVSLLVFKGEIQTFTKPKIVPSKVITNPAGYPAGTQIALYNQVPAAFPKNLWTGTGAPTHVDAVNNRDGTTQTTVVYATSEKIQAAMDAEVQNLIKNGWRITQNNLLQKAGFMTAVSGSGNLTVTFAPAAGSTQVTFQLAQSGK